MTLEELEALVRANDDEASWQVLEDWLLETNDPRARFVRLEKAGHDTGLERLRLAEFLFAGAERKVHGSDWRAGYARLASARFIPREPRLELAKMPAFVLARVLSFGSVKGTLLDAVTAAAEFGDQLELLNLGYEADELETLDASLLPPLEKLIIGNESLELSCAPNLDSLRNLTLRLAPPAVMSLLREGRFKELRTLTVRTGALLDPWRAAFEALFEGTCAPRLDSLILEDLSRRALTSIDFLRDLAVSPLAARLHTLSFLGTECSPDSLRRLGRSIASVSDLAL